MTERLRSSFSNRPWRELPALLTAWLLLLIGPVASAQEPGERGDYDRRTRLALSAQPQAHQMDALAALREDLGGSLLDSIDAASGVTRSLYNPVGKLTPPNAGEPLDIAMRFARENATLLGLEPSDLDEIELCDVVRSAVSGAAHVYLCQKYQGIDVFNAQLHVNVSGDGSVLSVNNSFVPGLASQSRENALSIEAEDACMAVANHLGLDVRRARRIGRRIRAADLSTEPIVPELTWVPEGRNVKLAWRFQLHTPDGQHVYDVTVDAEAGPDPDDSARVITRFDRVSPGLYEVYGVPVESPSHAAVASPEDGRDIVVNPEDNVASPLGWHDDGAQSYQIMRGNNVHAYDDRDANDAPPAVQPDCGPGLECSFPLDLTTDPSTYKSAAVANLFYWSNIVHDVQYRYGFDEAAGNFQFDNFGLGGLGGDAVRAEAQDGSGIDNANFTVAPDGSPPKIQMFLWDLTFPLRDGDFDAGIIVHEYGHGISTRLVGGPSTISCLSNLQQPGEGLSDFWALAYTARPEDAGPDPRGIGTYVLGSPPGGFGIRTQAYSTDPTVNTHTYATIQGMAVPHGVGEVWAQAAWEAYWTLVHLHGFDANLYDAMGGAGNQRMMLYVNEGLKNTACSPTFTDVRDGIIQAAIDNYDGEDVCFLWEAFAGFGLGEDAISGGPFSTFAVNGFQIPSSCLAGPRVVSPISGSVLSGSTVTFDWTADQDAVDGWVLDIGSSRGAFDIYTSGALPGTTLSAMVATLPVDGRPVFVRLNYLVGTEWGFRDALYTADLATPEIVDPVSGAVLEASMVAFTWDGFGLPVENWSLDVGSLPASGDFYQSGPLTSDVLTVDVTGLPTDGRTIYARLQYFFDGDWKFVDTSYVTADIVPTLTTPTPGSTLSGSDVTFAWDDNGALVDDWVLYLGSAPGSSDLFNSGSLESEVSSIDVTNLPTNGAPIYMQLRYAFRFAWSSIDHVYTAADLAPEILSPGPGSVLSGASVLFSWTSHGAPVTAWVLEIGSAPGSSNYFYSGTLAGDVVSATATGIPTDSRDVYMRLRYQIGNSWVSLDREYVAADLVPVLTTPTPGSTLSGSNVTIAWNGNGALVDDWVLYIGSTPGSSDVFNSGLLGSGVSSIDVTNLPTNGAPVYVQLRYALQFAWSSIDYVYVAADLAPEILSPVPASVLSGSSVPFSWTSNGAAVNAWILEIGSAPGSSNYFYSGTLAGDVVTATATGIPTDSRDVYMRLRYRIGTSWVSLNEKYVAADLVPVLTSPEPGSVFPGEDVTFAWTTNGSSVSNWTLGIGSVLGTSNYYYSGTLAGSVQSAFVTGLPLNSSTVHVRLRYLSNAVWHTLDYVHTSAAVSPAITVPPPGTALSDTTVSFGWADNGSVVTDWELDVGSTLGAADIFDGGLLPAATRMLEVSRLPTDGQQFSVRLKFRISDVWSFADFLYTADLREPAMTFPVPGSVLPGPNHSFQWSTHGATVTGWRLRVGNTAGSGDLHDSGPLPATTLDRFVTNLPTDGRDIHVRLEYGIDGESLFKDYLYTAGVGVPKIETPAAGSVLPSSDVTFSWTSNDAPVTTWILYVGTSPGSSKYYYSGSLTADVLTAEITGLPTDSRTIHARLRYLLNGVWKSADFQYTAADLSPQMQAPAPGSLLTGSTAAFSWTSGGAPVTRWILYVGTKFGSRNVYYSGTLASDVTTANVTGLPTDSATIYVRLRYVVNGVWQQTDFEYIAADLSPSLLTPTPGSVLTGANETFSWTDGGAAVTRWILYVGTGLGSSNLHYSGSLSSAVTTATVTGLPTDSRTIYVRLRYSLNGYWKHTDYQYTAADLVPELVAPAPGGILASADQNFTWTSNGAPVTGWLLYVGTSVGSSNLFYSGSLASGVLSADLSGLPTDGRTLYVRLRYVANGAWKSLDYQYTAASAPAP